MLPKTRLASHKYQTSWEQTQKSNKVGHTRNRKFIMPCKLFRTQSSSHPGVNSLYTFNFKFAFINRDINLLCVIMFHYASKVLSFVLRKRKIHFKHLTASCVDLGAHSLGCKNSRYFYDEFR